MLKLTAVTIILLALSLLTATAADPVNQYLEQPDYASFEAAVKQLSAQLKDSPMDFNSRLYLHYICDLEASRVMDSLMAQADSLAPGQRFNLANLLLGKKQYDRAINLYDAINKEFPAWSCPWRHKGEAHYETGNYPAAAQALEQAIATNEKHWDAYIWMARAQKELGLYKEALANLDKARTLTPEEEESVDEHISDASVKALYEELQKLVK